MLLSQFQAVTDTRKLSYDSLCAAGAAVLGWALNSLPGTRLGLRALPSGADSPATADSSADCHEGSLVCIPKWVEACFLFCPLAWGGGITFCLGKQLQKGWRFKTALDQSWAPGPRGEELAEVAAGCWQARIVSDASEAA